MNWKVLTTVFLSIGLLLSGCNSTNEPEGKAAENTGWTETDMETKEKETTEPISFDEGEYPDDFPWPVLDDWEAKKFTTRIYEGEKYWNGVFYYDMEPEKMADEYKKVLEKAGFTVTISVDPESVDAEVVFSISGRVGDQLYLGGMFFRINDDGTYSSLAAVRAAN